MKEDLLRLKNRCFTRPYKSYLIAVAAEIKNNRFRSDRQTLLITVVENKFFI